MTIKKTFMRFLKETNSYNGFIANMNGKYKFWDCNWSTLEEFLNNEKGEQLVEAFSWIESKEGEKQWFDLNKKWRRISKYYGQN